MKRAMAAGGSLAASRDFVDFYRRENPRVVGTVSLYCGDADVAAELAQEALVRACERWDEVREMSRPGAWVHRVAMNLANSYYRRRRAERRARQRQQDQTDQTHRDPDAADAVAIRRAVSSLPRRQREALIWRYYVAMSVAETAEQMGTTDSAVKSLTYRATNNLRDELEGKPSASDREVGDAQS